MSNFFEKLKDVQENVSVTEKGMKGYKHTNHALVDFNFKVSSYRQNIVNAHSDFEKVLKEKESYALKYLFYLRDAREGIGERNLFRACIRQLLSSNISNKNEIVSTIIEQTPEFGRWDDLWLFLDTEYKDKVIEVTKAQLRSDFANYKAKKSVSLLAKWLPSANASRKETKRLANLMIKSLGTTPREYRKTLSTLRAYIDVTEVKTCSNEWEEIDYNKVPSKANLKYKNAFLKHDEERRRLFLSKALAGDKEVKVHMGVSFPHEIVHQYTNGGWGINVKGFDQSLEAYWKNLKPCVGLKDTIVVRDGSGSMSDTVGGTKITALDVSTALAIYCSEQLEGGFKNKFITFDNEAKLVDLTKCGSLHSKLNIIGRFNECGTTNIQNVFELILGAAVHFQMKPEDMPSTVLIISDMEFDPVGGKGWNLGMNAGANVFEHMHLLFKEHGYKLPKLAFWNVNSRTGTIPCVYNENGVLLISGFSQNVLNMVMNGKTDPYDALIEELNKERYAKIPLVTYNNVTIKTVKKTKVIDTPDFLK